MKTLSKRAKILVAILAIGIVFSASTMIYALNSQQIIDEEALNLPAVTDMTIDDQEEPQEGGDRVLPSKIIVKVFEYIARKLLFDNLDN